MLILTREELENVADVLGYPRATLRQCDIGALSGSGKMAACQFLRAIFQIADELAGPTSRGRQANMPRRPGAKYIK